MYGHTYMYAMFTTKAVNDKRCDHIPLPLSETIAHTKQHQHVVTITHTHCIEVAQNIRTRNPAL